jgi:hypothetical protein
MSAIQLVSPIPPDECADRLQAAINRDGLLSLFASQPVIGKVSEWSVWLRKRIGYANAFQKVLRGEFEAHRGGTIFHGQFSFPLPILIFGTLYFPSAAILAFVGMVEAIQVLARGAALNFEALGGELLPLPFGLGVFGMGRWFARNEEKFLVDFLATVIGAHRESTTESLS